MFKCKKGVGFIEYVLVFALIALVLTTQLTELNENMSLKFDKSMKGTNPLSINYIPSSEIEPMITKSEDFKENWTENMKQDIYNSSNIPNPEEPKIDWVDVYKPPEDKKPLAIIRGPAIVKPGQTVTYIDDSYSLYNELVKSIWTYPKNGQMIEETKQPRQQVTIRFNEVGTYNIYLTVVDEKGLKDSTVYTVEVKEQIDNIPPVAVVKRIMIDEYIPHSGEFQYTRMDKIKIGETVTLSSDSYDTDGYITKLVWEYQENGVDKIVTTNANGTISISPKYEGFFDVKLTAYDNKGAYSSTTYTYAVIKDLSPPQVIIESSLDRGENLMYYPEKTYVVGETYKFYDISTDDGMILFNSWGNMKTRKSYIEKTFSKPGTYKIELEVMDNNWNISYGYLEVTLKEKPPNTPPVAILDMPERIYEGDGFLAVDKSYDNDYCEEVYGIEEVRWTVTHGKVDGTEEIIWNNELKPLGSEYRLENTQGLRYIKIKLVVKDKQGAISIAEKTTRVEGKVDIVFVIDKTGSMSNAANNVKNSIIEFSQNLYNNYVDTRFAIITYERNAYIRQNFTSNVSDVIRTLNKFRTEGGTEYTGYAISKAIGMDWRKGENVKKFIIFFTDEPGDDGNYYSIARRALEKGIVINGITNGHYKLNTFANVTGGLISKTVNAGLSTYRQVLNSFVENWDLR